MKKDFVMRGQTASGQTEVLNFSGFKPGMAYKITEFSLWPSTNIGGVAEEMTGTVTAAKTAESVIEPNFNNDGLIATSLFATHSTSLIPNTLSIVNDTFLIKGKLGETDVHPPRLQGKEVTRVKFHTFLITQNLILMVQNTTSATPVNWQCRFESVKMSGSEEAVTNYKQFTISDE